MASNLKVDIVKPTATNGSLSLKGDSGGSATTNGISVDSSGDTSITGTTTVSQLNADNIRIDGNTISSTDTNGDINLTPNGTGKVVTSKADINGGAIDGTTIGASSAAAGSFTSVDATSASLDGAVTINESGADVDFRVESDGSENALFVEGSSGNVGIGTSSTGMNSAGLPLVVGSGTGNTGITIFSGNNASGSIHFSDTETTSNESYKGYINYAHDAEALRFGTNSTEQMRIDSSGNLKFDSGYGSVATAYGCRAWVNFNGTGTVAIRESGNVSSITDDGTGNYIVTFAEDMPDVDYSIVANAANTGTDPSNRIASAAPIDESSFRIHVRVGTDASFSDQPQVHAVIFR